MRTDMDVLVLGSFILEKTEQPVKAESDEWREEFVLD
jgi:carbamoyltransferase